VRVKSASTLQATANIARTQQTQSSEHKFSKLRYTALYARTQTQPKISTR